MIGVVIATTNGIVNWRATARRAHGIAIIRDADAGEIRFTALSCRKLTELARGAGNALNSAADLGLCGDLCLDDELRVVYRDVVRCEVVRERDGDLAVAH